MVEIRDLCSRIDAVDGIRSMRAVFDTLDTEHVRRMAAESDAFVVYFSPTRRIRSSFFNFELEMAAKHVEENPKATHPSIFIIGSEEDFPYEAYWVKHIDISTLGEISKSLNNGSKKLSGVIIEDDDGYYD